MSVCLIMCVSERVCVCVCFFFICVCGLYLDFGTNDKLNTKKGYTPVQQQRQQQVYKLHTTNNKKM